MKGAAYHSSNPADPVHHDHDDCPTGQQIPSWNRVAGTGGLPYHPRERLTWPRAAEHDGR